MHPAGQTAGGGDGEGNCEEWREGGEEGAGGSKGREGGREGGRREQGKRGREKSDGGHAPNPTSTPLLPTNHPAQVSPPHQAPNAPLPCTMWRMPESGRPSSLPSFLEVQAGPSCLLRLPLPWSLDQSGGKEGVRLLEISSASM